jgi:cysteinyl-tRNA synthetase
LNSLFRFFADDSTVLFMESLKRLPYAADNATESNRWAQAVQRSANAEAISHLTAALDLLKALPDTRKRIQQELTLQIALGAPLVATKGWGAPEVEDTYSRARELCTQEGDDAPQLFSILNGLLNFYVTRAELRKAKNFAMADQIRQRLTQLGVTLEDRPGGTGWRIGS